ncbi:MAG: hypothetical protein KF764_16320 [Labilithrix sp.]|nr:hypothetical protein [Labilithrix sp.]
MAELSLKTWLRNRNIHNVVADTRESLRAIGFVRTCGVIRSRLEDFVFDARYGTDTTQINMLEELELDDESRRHGQRYQPTGAYSFRNIMRRLAPPPGSVFVDYGSGKGRVLMMAALHPFARVVGIEFSTELCDIARRNVDDFRSQEAKAAPIDIVDTDVRKYEYRHDETVFYFFHPFDEAILRATLDGIRESLEARPRRASLVYYLPKHRALVEREAFFQLRETFTIGGYDCMIFDHTPRR